ncbi:ESX secretion-associated protein EspG [Rhodococcus sp. NPDC058505]|uniref:ESX secretion-associated protein EspG n=1 Tax=unclassified Rhodococcus (in: high G+C Gram-positive bacteria) TaxID=192944 RepID=UPI003656AA63
MEGVSVRGMIGATTAQWQVAAVEFDILWRLHGRDRLPYPLRCRGSADTADRHRRDRRAAAARMRAVLDEDLHEALTILLDPAVRVEVCGFHGVRLGSVTRLHAGIRGGVGALAAQAPGTDAVRISLLPDRAVPAAIAGALPAAPRGTGGGVTGRRRVPAPGAVLRPIGDREAALAAFLGLPRTGIGEIGVHPGPAVDWRPSPDGAVVHWMDHPDGRYLVRGSDAAEVLPVSEAELAAQLRALIAAVG